MWSQHTIGFDLSNGLLADYDMHERVLLVARRTPDLGWSFYKSQPVGEWLRIHRQKDGVDRVIEWRRDCIIFVDSEGVATYVSLPIQDLKKALSSPIGQDERVSDIVNRFRPGLATATSPSTTPTTRTTG
jgi:hypothetical protein